MDRLTPAERATNLIEAWKSIVVWEDRYKKLIETGKMLPVMPDEMKTEDNKVRGCQSQVWIFSKKNEDGTLHYWGDSDALLVKGLVSLVLSIYSDAKPEDILKTPPDFVKTLGFETGLTPSRTNGLYAMIKRVIMDAFTHSKK